MRNVMLVCDADMVSSLLRREQPPKLAGTNYLLSKARVDGVFHPKVIVQIGKNRGAHRRFANATASGLAATRNIRGRRMRRHESLSANWCGGLALRGGIPGRTTKAVEDNCVGRAIAVRG